MSDQNSSAQRVRAELALLFLVIVYALSIDLKGIWGDEGYRYFLITGGRTWQQYSRGGAGSFADVIRAVGPTSYQPLFYLVDNAVLRLAQTPSDILLRLVNVFWFWLGARGVLRFFRDYSERTRLFGLAVFALNGFVLLNVMQIREYPMFLALMFWTSILCFEILEMPAEAPWGNWWPRLAGYGALAALLFYTHVFSLFALAAQAVVFLARKQDRRRFLRRLMLSYGVLAALVLPWVFLISTRYAAKLDPGVWDRRTPGIKLLIATLMEGCRFLFTYGLWSGYPQLQAAVLLFAVGVPCSWIAAKKMGERIDRRAVYAVLTIVFFGLFQVAYFFKQVFATWPRYFFAYYFGYTVLATCAFAVLDRVSRRKNTPEWKLASLAVFFLVCLSGLSQLSLYRSDPYLDTDMNAKDNRRTVSRAMLQYARPADTIVYPNSRLAWAIEITIPYYANELFYEDILNAGPPKVAGLWVLDTSGPPEMLKRVFARLDSSGYRSTKAFELGYNCRLVWFETGEQGPKVSESVRGGVPARGISSRPRQATGP